MAALLGYLGFGSGAAGTAAAAGTAGGTLGATGAGGAGASLAGLGGGAATGAFGASGAPLIADVYGTTFGASAAPQALSFADKLAAFGGGLKDFGLGVLNPGGGRAAGNISTAQRFGRSPATGDVIQLIVQQLLNQELGKSLGPFQNAARGYAQNTQRPRLSASVGPTWGARAKQVD